MQSLYLYIYDFNSKVDGIIIKALGGNPHPVIYWSVLTLTKLIIWGGLACILASITGAKRYIDKKMKWAQR
jgi:hypothetical protein